MCISAFSIFHSVVNSGRQIKRQLDSILPLCALRSLTNYEFIQSMKRVEESCPGPQRLLSTTLTLFDRIAVPANLYSLNKLIKIAAQCMRIIDAAQIWNSVARSNCIEHIAIDSVAHCLCAVVPRATAQSASRRERRVFCRVLRGMLRVIAAQHHRIRVESIGAVMTALRRCHLHRTALSVFRNFHAHNDVTVALALRSAHSSDSDADRTVIDALIAEHIDFARRAHSVPLQIALIECAAQRGFELIPRWRRSTEAWNARMTQCVRHGEHTQCLALYREMNEHSHDDVSHLLALRACIALRKERCGTEIAQRLHTKSALSPQLRAVLIEFHGEFGDARSARAVLESMPATQLSVQCVGAMMKCYVRLHRGEDALKLHASAEARALNNDATHLMALRACIACGRFEYGLSMTAKLRKLRNQMIVFLGTVGCVEAAQSVFEATPAAHRDIVGVNAMMNALCTNERHSQCLALFDAVLDDDDDGVRPDRITFAVALKACSHSASLFVADAIYARLRGDARFASILRSTDVRVALVSMFGRCGDTENATEVFAQSEAEAVNVSLAITNWTRRWRCLQRCTRDMDCARITERCAFC